MTRIPTLAGALRPGDVFRRQARRGETMTLCLINQPWITYLVAGPWIAIQVKPGYVYARHLDTGVGTTIPITEEIVRCRLPVE